MRVLRTGTFLADCVRVRMRIVHEEQASDSFYIEMASRAAPTRYTNRTPSFGNLSHALVYALERLDDACWDP
jgi:hypothetical protein